MQNPFSYKITKDHKLIVYRLHKQIKIIKGAKADAFIQAQHTSSEEEIQMRLAKLTGHYKHGNEKQNKLT